jgi:hypothetical protein
MNTALSPKPRPRAPGGGRKPKPPGEKILSKQIRVSLESYAKLKEISAATGKPFTEIVASLLNPHTRKEQP